jgi:hypothetical protein
MAVIEARLVLSSERSRHHPPLRLTRALKERMGWEMPWYTITQCTAAITATDPYKNEPTNALPRRDERRHTGNNNDHPRMQRFLFMESKKVRTIIRYKRVILCANSSHELPVFRTSEIEIVDVIG